VAADREAKFSFFLEFLKDGITGMLHPWNRFAHIPRHMAGGVLSLLDLLFVKN